MGFIYLICVVFFFNLNSKRIRCDCFEGLKWVLLIIYCMLGLLWLFVYIVWYNGIVRFFIFIIGNFRFWKGDFLKGCN